MSPLRSTSVALGALDSPTILIKTGARLVGFGALCSLGLNFFCHQDLTFFILRIEK
jgi:hypothetical protein